VLDLTDEQRALADSVRRFLSDSGLPRTGYAEAREPHDDLWRGLSEIGVIGALAPESAGGLALGLGDIGGVLIELGRACYPGPFISSAVGATTLLAGIGDTALLPAVASGEVIAVIVGEQDGPVIPDVPAADVLLVASGHTVSVVEGVTARPEPTADGSRSFGRIDPRRLTGHVLSSSAGDAVAAARDVSLIAWAADGLGTAHAIFELAREHALSRQQFDVPIGSFQAVQHTLVDAYAVLEAGKVGIQAALVAADSGDAADRHRAATMVGAWCCDGFARVAAIAVQTLGGIGFTWEHDAHLYYKRLLSLQTAYGGTATHLEELAALTV
jgi:alkylation response protein AidB-like acyl-CoA dehydrogenase